MTAMNWQTEAEEQAQIDLEDEIAENKLDPWCICGYQLSAPIHLPPQGKYFIWDAARNKCEAPEGGNVKDREGFYE